MREHIPPLAVHWLVATGMVAGADFAWQENYAALSPEGDIRWAPREFVYKSVGTVRYIDFEGGDDANEGTRAAPWRHHPWDAAAEGRAATANGVDTFVFKGGVTYRGLLTVPERGASARLVRLTRDPDWGEGAAVLAGSRRLSGFRRGAHPKIPDGGKVWMLDLDVAPRSLWMVGADERGRRIPLARHPNWVSQPEDHKAEWFSWTNEKHPFKAPDGWTSNDSRNLKGLDPDFVVGALMYSEFGWVMGTPYPTLVLKYDPGNGAVQFAGWTGGGNAGVIHRGMRYYLEDKPQFLDDPDGEFWFERKGHGGTLYLRLPGDADPNRVRLEAGFRPVLIEASAERRLEISGLDFRWTSMYWNLAVAAWDFGAKPYGIRKDGCPAAIRVRGDADGVRIAHCRFEDVAKGIDMRPVKPGQAIRDVTIEDNRFRNADIGAVHMSNGTGWGFANPFGRLDNIKVYRNHAADIGFRPTRYERGCAFDFTGAEVLNVAGNVIERSGAQAINVVGGKAAGVRGGVPLVRILIHQNKAWKTMQNGNDFGGIETWQHGPVYTFNNVSHDARGQWEGRRRTSKDGSPGFGHAYYLDGAFKNYHFNNIAWGKSGDPTSPLANCSAFQEIHSFQNTFFNNTIYNYVKGSRRQAPEAGRDKFIGNVWQDVSDRVFRHSDPAKSPREANADHAGRQGGEFDMGTNAYARNVFHNVSRDRFGTCLPDGGWIATLEEFGGILKASGAMVATVGEVDAESTLVDPAAGDFRLHEESAAVDGGGRVFVPWSLAAVVAEWHFLPAGDDPTRIVDEHWFARDYMTDREWYRHQPMYPLKAVNVRRSDYVPGPLENFTSGALKFDPARRTHAVLADAILDRPLNRKMATRARHGQDPAVREIEFVGRGLRNAEVYEGNFLIEAVFQSEGDGVLIRKKARAGYEVVIEDGRAVFAVEGEGGQRAEVRSRSTLADGEWHHLLVEADRTRDALRVHVDGKLDASGRGIGTVSLANSGDLFVGGTDEGGYLAGALEFMRIGLATLEESRTTIEELFAWEFNGPALRDFSGRAPLGEGRDAGAIESH